MRFSDLPISCGPHLIQNFHEDELGLDVPNLSTLSLFRQPPREQANEQAGGRQREKGTAPPSPARFPVAAQKAPWGGLGVLSKSHMGSVICPGRSPKKGMNKVMRDFIPKQTCS